VRNLFASASVAVAATLFAAPALAQIPSSSSEVRGTGWRKDYVDGAVELRRLAMCEIRRSPGYARALLDSMPDSNVESRITHAIGKVIENCLTDYRPAIQFNGAALRGAVAEAFYLAAYPTAPDFAAIKPGGATLPEAWLTTKRTPYQTSEVIAQDFGQCVVAADLADADSLVRTEPRSAAEDVVVARLQPYLGPCLMQGQTYHLDVTALRSYLAQGLYRLVGGTAIEAHSKQVQGEQ